jgi:hypothetical protein
LIIIRYSISINTSNPGISSLRITNDATTFLAGAYGALQFYIKGGNMSYYSGNVTVSMLQREILTNGTFVDTPVFFIYLFKHALMLNYLVHNTHVDGDNL